MTTTLDELFGDKPADADTHKPQDRPGYVRAAKKLQQMGLSDRDIAAALNLTAPTVRELLIESIAEVHPRYRGKAQP